MKHSFWHLDLFGGLRAVPVDLPQAFPIETFGTQKAASLLAFLAFYRQAHRREVLAEMFWPEATPHNARNSLRVALSGLREQLEVEGVPEDGALSVKRETLAIAPSVSTDVAQFRAHLQDAHFEVQEAERLRKLETAVELVRGPLLRGFYDDWISGEAARLEDEFLSALRQIMTFYEGHQDYQKALEAARRGTIAAPLREGVVRDLVRLGYACGQEENVKAEFEAFRRRVERVGGSVSVGWNEFLRRATQIPLRGALSTPEPALPEVSLGSPTSVATLPSATRAPAWQPALGALKPLPRATTSFVGRERDLHLLEQLLAAPATRLVTIIGPGGAGKTRLALETIRQLAPAPSGESATELVAPTSATPTPIIAPAPTFGAFIWLPLANLPSARLLPGTLLAALGAPAFKEDIESVALVMRQLSETLASEALAAGPGASSVAPRLLLVVDNCEHLEKSVAHFVGDLLARVPTLTVLGTSRSSLGLGGEHPYRLASLDANATTPATALPNLVARALLQNPSDAVRLFVERAQQAKSDFQLTLQNAPLLSQICAHVGGLPLAIEIVAARVAQLSLEQIAAGLGVLGADGAVARAPKTLPLSPPHHNGAAHEALRLLGQGLAPKADELIRSLGLLDWSNPNPNASERHSSLRSTIEWSAEQLSPALARFWAKLSVFQQSFSVEAAVEVCNEPFASTYLQTLRDMSLLASSASAPVTASQGSPTAPTEGTRAATRVMWLHPLHEFAAELLAPEDKNRIEARHADYFLRWAIQMAPLLNHPDGIHEQRQMEAEAVNLRSALLWLLDHDVEGALRFANALCWHWEQQGDLVEGRLAVETALERSGAVFADLEAQLQRAATTQDGGTPEATGERLWERLRERAQALEGAGKMANMVADHEAANRHLPEALRLFRLLNDEGGIASCLYALGFNALRRGAHETAWTLCEESLEITRSHNDPVLLADALYNLSMVALVSGDYPAVRALSAERLALCRALNYPRGLAMSLENLGMAALREGDLGAASTYFAECLTAFETLDDKPSVARILWGLGQVALYNQRLDEAHDHFVRAASLMQITHNLWAIPYVLESFGTLAVAQKQWQRAAILLGGAAGLRQRQGEPLVSEEPRREFERMCQATRSALGEAAFDAGWQRGLLLERKQILQFAASWPE